MGKRVLVCEDDDAIRLLLSKVLSRQGLSVDAVRTGTEALGRLHRDPYDLVLLDLLTPGTSGYDVLDYLRRERPYSLDRVVVVTAQQRAFDERLPVAAMLRKPFDLRELDRVVGRILFPSPNRPFGGGDQRRMEGESR